MSRGRSTPPVVVAPVRADDPSQDVDGAFFREHPQAVQYERAYLRGETAETMPYGTKVIVKRFGATRARAFIPPQEGLN